MEDITAYLDMSWGSYHAHSMFLFPVCFFSSEKSRQYFEYKEGLYQSLWTHSVFAFFHYISYRNIWDQRLLLFAQEAKDPTKWDFLSLFRANLVVWLLSGNFQLD